MYKNKKIAVVVPAYNEELLIGRVIETMPEYVDKIVVVDDRSRDETCSRVRSYMNNAAFAEKLLLIEHSEN